MYRSDDKGGGRMRASRFGNPLPRQAMWSGNLREELRQGIQWRQGHLHESQWMRLRVLRASAAPDFLSAKPRVAVDRSNAVEPDWARLAGVWERERCNKPCVHVLVLKHRKSLSEDGEQKSINLFFKKIVVVLIKKKSNITQMMSSNQLVVGCC